jgi:hypothetical protein
MARFQSATGTSPGAAQQLDLAGAELVESRVVGDADVTGTEDRVGTHNRVALDGGQAADELGGRSSLECV